jgi:hypothetical protein
MHSTERYRRRFLAKYFGRTGITMAIRRKKFDSAEIC